MGAVPVCVSVVSFLIYALVNGDIRYVILVKYLLIYFS